MKFILLYIFFSLNIFSCEINQTLQVGNYMVVKDFDHLSPINCDYINSKITRAIEIFHSSNLLQQQTQELFQCDQGVFSIQIQQVWSASKPMGQIFIKKVI